MHQLNSKYKNYIVIKSSDHFFRLIKIYNVDKVV